MQPKQTNDRLFKVLVPSRMYAFPVVYPPSNHPLYTREEAIELLKRFERHFEQGYAIDGVDERPWAESENERFDMDDIKQKTKGA